MKKLLLIITFLSTLISACLAQTWNPISISTGTNYGSSGSGGGAYGYCNTNVTYGTVSWGEVTPGSGLGNDIGSGTYTFPTQTWYCGPYNVVYSYECYSVGRPANGFTATFKTTWADNVTQEVGSYGDGESSVVGCLGLYSDPSAPDYYYNELEGTERANYSNSGQWGATGSNTWTVDVAPSAFTNDGGGNSWTVEVNVPSAAVPISEIAYGCFLENSGANCLEYLSNTRLLTCTSYGAM